jgi:hypothetical protein
MVSPEIAALADRLETDPRTQRGSVLVGIDNALGFGANVIRLVWCDQFTIAVGESADLPTACGGVLDALALLLHPASPLVAGDRAVINLLIDRPLPQDPGTEADQAVRTLRFSVSGVMARIWYQRELPSSWVEDVSSPPDFRSSRAPARWVNSRLLPRLRAVPEGLATDIVEMVADDSLQLYPAPITQSQPDLWSLRLDGLEIGKVSSDRGMLAVGKPGGGSTGGQRQAFLSISGGVESVCFTYNGDNGTLTLGQAAELISRYAYFWRRQSMPIDVPGSPVCHRESSGSLYLDEHALEARLLKGIARLRGFSAAGLVGGDEMVARGSQFPTLWSDTGGQKYLDALLSEGATPLAVELKVASGGQGRYYQRSLIQAVLYRHFIRSVGELDPWFVEADLDRLAVRGVVGLAEPRHWTKSFSSKLAVLRQIADHIGIDVEVIDDRRTPELETTGELDSTREHTEHLSWLLAAALYRRWPTSLGNVVHVNHEGGGLYDMLRMQSTKDHSFTVPSPLSRISLNRPGSVWVRSHQGTDRWVWRGIWSALQGGMDPDEAAETIGFIAGLPVDRSRDGANLPEIAALLTARSADIRWTCAWDTACGDTRSREATIPPGLRGEFRRYRGSGQPDSIPSLARLWCAQENGVTRCVVDQKTLTGWTTRGGVWRKVEVRGLSGPRAVDELSWG